jgi:geranylgeranyl transferase type-2 subunit alpha
MQKHSKVYDNESFMLTAQLIQRNPEEYSVLNYRRLILRDGLFKDCPTHFKIDTLVSELRFMDAQLREFPKCYWLWNHRRWCLETSPAPDWEGELALVTKMLQRDDRNCRDYLKRIIFANSVVHGWNYRRYVVANIERANGKDLSQEEFEYTQGKINTNLSNFSAWHQRTLLIPRLITTHDQRSQFLEKGNISVSDATCLT